MDEDQWYALAKSQQSVAWKDGYDTAKDAYDRVFAELRAEVQQRKDHHDAEFAKWNHVNNLRALMHSDYRDAFRDVLALIDGGDDDVQLG